MVGALRLLGFLLISVGCTDPVFRFLDAGDTDAGADGGTADAGLNFDGRTGIDGGSCETGQADCDGDPSNGCEVALDTDADNCGSCGNSCGSDIDCSGGRCRQGQWVDAWECPAGSLEVRSVAVDDDEHLFATASVPNECAPLGETPLGARDWGVVRYQAVSGARDAAWVARYGSTEDDQVLAADTDGTRTFIAGICRTGIDFGAGPITLDSNSGCLVEFSLGGNVVRTRLVTGEFGENLPGVAPVRDGGVITAGTSRSPSIDVGPGCDPLTGTGDDGELFVVRYQPDGSCQWANRYPSHTPDDGSGNEVVTHAAVDAASNSYVVGTQRGTTTFDNTRVADAEDAFVLSLDPDGEFRWIFFVSGLGDDSASALAVGDGGVFVGVRIEDSVTIDGTMYTPQGVADSLVLRLDSNTGSPQWVVQVSGMSAEKIEDLAYDVVRQQVIAAGWFGTTTPPDETITVGNLSGTANGNEALSFILDAGSGQAIHISTFGGPNTDRARTVAVDRGGAVYLGGRFRGTATFPDGTELNGPTAAGANAGFVLRWEPAAL